MTNKDHLCYCINTKPHPKEWHDRRVGPRGPEDAAVMFVGMAPGYKEAQTGLVFNGGAGYRLKTDALAAGLPFQQCRLANVAEYWPRNHNLNNLSKTRIDEGRTALFEDIERVDPQIVVPLGNDALECLTGKRRISKWRGSTFDLSDFQPHLPPALVIPTLHPSAVLRMWDYHTLFMNDLSRVRAAMSGDEVHAPDRQLIVPGDDEYTNACDAILQLAQRGKTLAADIETFRGELACISFAADPLTAVSVDPDDRDVWQTVLESGCPIVWHNAMYDLTFLKAKRDVEQAGPVHDTQLMWHALYPSLACSKVVGKSLALLTSLFTNENYYKDTLKEWRKVADWDSFYRYNAKDSAVTIEVFDALRRRLDADDERIRDVYDFERALVRPYRDASIRGVKIDTRRKGARAAATKRKIDKIEEKLIGLVDEVTSELDEDDPRYKTLHKTGESFNPRSYPQVMAAMATMMSVEESQIQSSDKETLTNLTVNWDEDTNIHRFATLMLEHRKYQKAYGTYYAFDYDDDGRIRTNWIIPGTETGRMANSKSIIFAGGANLMTIPYPAREFFIADDGYKLVYADLAQAEARIVAYYADCERLIETFEAEGDNYKYVASWMYDKDISDVTKEERYLAKRCVLGLLYGMGPRKWAKEVNIDKGYEYMSTKEARRLHNLFFDTFPEIRSYQKEIERRMRKSRQLWTPFGRRRMFRPRDGKISSHMYREGYDYIPQGTVPDIINTAVLDLRGYEPDIQQHGQIHDAWFGQAREDDGRFEDRLRTIKDTLTIPIRFVNINGEAVKLAIPVDMEVGDNWGPYDPEDNPNGLKEIEL